MQNDYVSFRPDFASIVSKCPVTNFELHHTHDYQLVKSAVYYKTQLRRVIDLINSNDRVNSATIAEQKQDLQQLKSKFIRTRAGTFTELPRMRQLLKQLLYTEQQLQQQLSQKQQDLITVKQSHEQNRASINSLKQSQTAKNKQELQNTINSNCSAHNSSTESINALRSQLIHSQQELDALKQQLIIAQQTYSNVQPVHQQIITDLTQKTADAVQKLLEINTVQKFNEHTDKDQIEDFGLHKAILVLRVFQEVQLNTWNLRKAGFAQEVVLHCEAIKLKNGKNKMKYNMQVINELKNIIEQHTNEINNMIKYRDELKAKEASYNKQRNEAEAQLKKQKEQMNIQTFKKVIQEQQFQINKLLQNNQQKQSADDQRLNFYFVNQPSNKVALIAKQTQNCKSKFSISSSDFKQMVQLQNVKQK
ncbi:Hypothetical_protein [Hexamita inflata]|uniref:Hypothetical_protein n=1 Tax=Hexamita inflata TaxID=28002 RepID=A0AA86RFJ1_9EUKA|nr:Hypothetical protein HINF_LOCUS63177 [Hexamita inflata]